MCNTGKINFHNCGFQLSFNASIRIGTIIPFVSPITSKISIRSSKSNLKLFFSCLNILISGRQLLPRINKAFSFALSNEIASIAKSCVLPMPAFSSTIRILLLSRFRLIVKQEILCHKSHLHIYHLQSSFSKTFAQMNFYSQTTCMTSNKSSSSPYN